MARAPRLARLTQRLYVIWQAQLDGHLTVVRGSQLAPATSRPARDQRSMPGLSMSRARMASVIAVGHMRDDQAETILHRIVRGFGLRGLAGMLQIRRVAADPQLAPRATALRLEPL